MGTVRWFIRACAIAGELYVTGGTDDNGMPLSSVKKYSPSSDTWRLLSLCPRLAQCMLRWPWVQPCTSWAVLLVMKKIKRPAFFEFDSAQGTCQVTP
jgi:hypothetical protein